MEHLSIYAFLISLVALVVAGKAWYEAVQPGSRFMSRLRKADAEAKAKAKAEKKAQ